MFSPKYCEDCGDEFVPTGPAAKYCPLHSAERRRNSAVSRTRKYREKRGCAVGVGKGGSNSVGKEDSQYQTGIARFMKSRATIRRERRYCNRCGRDLLDAGRYHWAIHHIDHDRTNNCESNWELLCKRCHQIEHGCLEKLKDCNDYRKAHKVNRVE